jgi:hypothetical protein
MDVIKAPTKIESIYRAEFRYAPPPGIKGRGINGVNDTDIQERLRGNIMEVGKPERWNLKELCKRKGIKLCAEIEMLCDEVDFWLIQSAFSFMPAPGNQLKWARMVARMEPLSEGMENPLVYDAYPKSIYQEKRGKHQISIGLTAEYVQEIEFTRLDPAITVAGIGTSEPTWDFSDRAAFNLNNVNASYVIVIVKTPIGSQGIKVSYFSYAQIQTRWAGIIPVTPKKPIKETYHEIKFCSAFKDRGDG